MKKSIILKTLLRAPVKTILTLLLIAAASFALFSRITDYAITTREAAKAESFYNGVAALDNTVPDMMQIEEGEGGIYYGTMYETDDKLWPTQDKLKEFSTLPGVTLTDTRYMTGGLVENYKRLVDEEYSDHHSGRFVLEGTYAGCESDANGEGAISLIFDEVKVLAGEIEQNAGKPIKIDTTATDIGYEKGYEAYSREFFESLKRGSKCLVVGQCNEVTGRELKYFQEKEDFCVLDNFKDNYLETKEFAYQKGMIEAINQSRSTYDIVYTKDTRAIPRFNERNMVIAQGRPLMKEDADVCVVSETFLKTHGLSVGDRINIQLGDKLFHQNPLYGAQARDAETISSFNIAADLQIVGAYRFVDATESRVSERKWSYTINTIFVPSTLLPIEIPEDYETAAGEFSVFVEDAHKIESFREAAEPLAAELGLGLRFSDGGYLSIRDSFDTGALTSFLTTVLYVIGAALALLLAVYLYIGRNKKSYAIMRTLGISGKKAGNSIVLPLCLLSVLAMPVGGVAGLFYASDTAAKALKSMAVTAPGDYVYILDATLPLAVILLCLFFELAFISVVTLLFLRKMKKISPLELLQEDVLRTGASKNVVFDQIESAPIPAEFDMTKFSVVEKMPADRKYGALQQAGSYILRHMRRGIGKTAVSLTLAIVLTAGVGMFVLARLTYQDAVSKVDVIGKALEYSSTSIHELSSSDLIEDFYCYGSFGVRVNNLELHTPLTITNNLERYLTDAHKITYAQGYDSSVLDSTGQVCLLGQELAKDLNISPGDEIALMSDTLYGVLKERYENEEELAAAVEQQTQKYKVIGIIESKDSSVCANIFTGINNGTESVYGQTYAIGYSEFKVADNEKVEQVSRLLEEQKKQESEYAPIASFHIDVEALENIKRVYHLLESLFPIAVAAAALIGVFGPGLVIMQSAKEAAFLRILGVTKKRARCMLVFEQIILCIAGIVLVAGGMTLYNYGLFARGAQTLAICWTLYLLSCICGASIAAVQVTRHRILELLQVKE